MGLPELMSFPLNEIAERWNTDPDKILRHAIEGLIEVSVMVVGIGVQVGYHEEGIDGPHPAVESEETVTGPLPLLLTDVWEILRDGQVSVEGFRSKVDGGFVSLLPMWSPQQFKLRDLVITRAERDRVEREHGLSVQNDRKKESALAIGFSHSSDFRRVSLGPKTFRFGVRQAAVVRQLFEAAETGDPWVPAATLLASSGSRSGRLIDLFKTQDNWRDLLIGDGAGRYRLANGESRRAYRRLGLLSTSTACSRSRDMRFFRKIGMGSNDPTTRTRTFQSD